jgi:hypothetical protein
MKKIILVCFIFLISNTFSQTETSKISNEDFLDKYFLKQEPINNSIFSLSLSKLILNNVKVGIDYKRTYENTVTSIPEIIDADNLVFWDINENMKIRYTSDFNFLANEVDYINRMLPKIEIIKNKFLTLKYPDGKEESFLFSSEIDSSDINTRTSLEIKLKSDFDNNQPNQDKSLIMKIYAIDGECYLTLSYNQLQRLSIEIRDDIEEIKMKYNDLYGESYVLNYNSDNGDEIGYTSGKNIFISRKSNRYYSEKISKNLLDHNYDEYKNQFINPESIIYLFKLIEN